MGLRLVYEDQEVIVPDGNTAVIGSDPDATVRVARPGISRRHVTVKNNGTSWVLLDASSRNGTYHDGARVQSLDVTGSTTITLGHPSDGPSISMAPTETSASAPTKVVPAAASPGPASPTATPTSPPSRPTSSPDIEILANAIRDQMKSIRGLTWSVWAMIFVTAVLALLTLFVGIIGNQ